MKSAFKTRVDWDANNRCDVQYETTTYINN